MTAITALALAGCPGTETPGSSGAKRILSFTVTVGEEAVEGAINETAHTITLALPEGAGVTALTPVITVSEKATVSPASGAVQDFTDPVIYTVTAEDATTQAYTVTAVVVLPLDQAVEAAEAALEAVMVSTDGSDVPAGTPWVSAEVKAALEAALATAEEWLADAEATEEEKDEAAAALAAAFAAFNEAKGTGTKPLADKTALNKAITDAKAAKTGIQADTSAANVPEGAFWVLNTVSDAFDAAISAAETVAKNAGATQAETDEAKKALDAAVKTFTEAKQTAPAVDKTALTDAITAAEAAKADVLVNTSASNVLTGKFWVTQEEMDALEPAISAAETTKEAEAPTQAGTDKAKTDLNAAVETFTAAKKAGTKAVGTGVITLTPPADIDDQAEGTFDNTPVRIYKQGPADEDKKVIVTANLSNLSNATIEWFLDNKSLGSDGSVTLTAANLLPGGHHLMLEVITADGAVWSRELTVIVDSGSKQGG
jgi:hypothetical protein